MDNLESMSFDEKKELAKRHWFQVTYRLTYMGLSVMRKYLVAIDTKNKSFLFSFDTLVSTNLFIKAWGIVTYEILEMWERGLELNQK